MKVIEIHQEHLIVCDNPSCNYNVINPTGEPSDSAEYINKPCPECGENLLTEEDYKEYVSLLNTVRWFNKYFGWLGYFFKKETVTTKRNVHVHNGIHITKENLEDK